MRNKKIQQKIQPWGAPAPQLALRRLIGFVANMLQYYAIIKIWAVIFDLLIFNMLLMYCKLKYCELHIFILNN